MSDEIFARQDNIISELQEQINKRDELLAQRDSALAELEDRIFSGNDEQSALRRIGKIKKSRQGTQPAPTPEPAPALDGDDAAALQKLAAAELKRLSRQLEQAETELANLTEIMQRVGGGRRPGEKLQSAREEKKAELEAKTLKLGQQRDRYQALLKKLEI